MSNNKTSHRVAKELREQILKRIKEEGVSVSQASEEHGVSTQAIYAWLSKGVTNNPNLKEMARLKKQNQELLALVGELTIKLSQAQKKI